MDLAQFKTLVEVERNKCTHEGWYADRYLQGKMAERLISIEEKLDALLKLQMQQILTK